MKLTVETVIEVLTAISLGYSYGFIETKTGVPKSTVKRIADRAKKEQIDPGTISSLSQGAIEAVFLPKRRARMNFVEPDWESVFIEHERPHHSVNLRILWERYSQSTDSTKLAMKYSTFCRAYEAYKKTLPASMQEVSMSFDWEPGEAAMIDYSGDPLHYTTADGKKHKAQIFVGVLPFSNLIFCMATENQTRQSWLLACMKMLDYFGAVPRYIFLDNSTSLVVRADTYDPKLCAEFNGMAAYYGFNPIAVRPGRPRDKASVENAVRICQQRITNRLVTSQFLSLEDVNSAISPLLEELNQRMVHDRLGTRRKLHQIELAVMQPLPVIPFEPGMQEKVLLVRKDYQIRLNNRRFSVPYQYAGKQVKIRLWPQTSLLVCYDLKTGKEIARHHYDEGGKVQNILLEHMPPNHVAVLRSKETLLDSIKTVSPEMWKLATRITRNQPLRIARRLLSGMLATTRTVGAVMSDEIAKAVLQRPEPTFDAFQKEVDSRLGQQKEDLNIGRGVRMRVKASAKNLRGKDYYAKRWAMEQDETTPDGGNHDK